ncbi:MAG: hypothetical protein KF760_18565 [Candidatus Eremiobacteraeota bacterium]|nr:hypothetical protein [Candidatus Eremiobacteraeota bacterium]MCW5867343.1 hypothetical protein [Candidatus Eremiobacteraeota bacterium]
MKRAFSLLELVFAAGLSFLLLTLTFRFFVPAVRISLRSQARVSMQQRCALSLQKLQADLFLTSAGAVSRTDEPDRPSILALQPLELRTTLGRPTYQIKLISYHVTGDRRLWRRIWQPPPNLGVAFETAAPHRISAAQLNQLAGLTGFFESHLLTGDVEQFTVSSAIPAPNVANPVRIVLVLEHLEHRCRMEQAVFLKNVSL